MRERSWFAIIYWGCVAAQGVGTLVTVSYAFGLLHGLVVTLALEALFVALHDGIEHKLDRRHTRALAVLAVYGLLLASGALQIAYARTFDATGEALARFEQSELTALAQVTAASPNLALVILVTLQLLGKIGTPIARSAKRSSAITLRQPTAIIAQSSEYQPQPLATRDELETIDERKTLESFAQATPAQLAAGPARATIDRARLAQALIVKPSATSTELGELFGVSAAAIRATREWKATR